MTLMPDLDRAMSTDTVASRPKRDTLEISFEFFPPKTDKMRRNLWHAIEELAPLKPRFVSVTYGAGGSTREHTHSIVTQVQHETGLKAAAHLTCVGETRENIDAIARRYWDAGIRHIVALRGDPPEGCDHYEPMPGGYAFGADLVAGLKRVADFEISVGAYPEVHPEAASAAADMDNFKRKLDAGATRAITQFFFETEDYFRFVERARAAGITVPIVPGVLPIAHFDRMCGFAGKCGAIVPDWLRARFDPIKEDPAAHKAAALDVAIGQCRELYDAGVREFHFYTLNRADLTTAICEALGVDVPATEAASA
jgi:methylenetetrahydrofolate reductase (NADPH)